MVPASHIPPCRSDDVLAEQLARAAAAGFQSVELAWAEDGLPGPRSSRDDCSQLASRAREAGLAVSGLAVDLGEDPTLPQSAPGNHRLVQDRLVPVLDRAAWLGTDTVVLMSSSVAGGELGRGEQRCEDVYLLWLRTLLGLRFEAEHRAVRIALAVGRGPLWPSPLQARDFLDRVNSPWVGACVNLTGSAFLAHPADWIRTLGRRVFSIHLGDDVFRSGPHSAGGSGVDVSGVWSAVFAAMHDLGYSGAITYCGPEDPVVVAAFLRQLLGVSSEPPPAGSVSK